MIMIIIQMKMLSMKLLLIIHHKQKQVYLKSLLHEIIFFFIDLHLVNNANQSTLDFSMVDRYRKDHTSGKRVMSDEDDQNANEITDMTRRHLNRNDLKENGLFKNKSFRKHSLLSYSLSLSLYSPIHFYFYHLDDSTPALLILDEHANDHNDAQNFTGNNLCLPHYTVKKIGPLRNPSKKVR